MEINNSSLLILGLTYSVLILRLVMTNYAKKSIENRKIRKKSTRLFMFYAIQLQNEGQ